MGCRYDVPRMDSKSVDIQAARTMQMMKPKSQQDAMDIRMP